MYSYYQNHHESKTLHYNTYHALVKVFEHHGCVLCRDEVLIVIKSMKAGPNFDTSKVNSPEWIAAKFIERDKALAITFLKRMERTRYSCFLVSLENQFSIDTDQYSINLSTTLTTLYCHVKPVTPHCRLQEPENNIDMKYTQIDDPVPEIDNAYMRMRILWRFSRDFCW